MVDGAPVLEAAAIDVDTVDAAIGGLTPAKRHAAVLATDALHRALAQAAASAARLALPPKASRGRESATSLAEEGRRLPPPNASPSPCRAASTAPSRRCWSASAGRRWSGSPSSSGPIPRPTAPRPAARRRRCSVPARSRTRSASRTSRSTSRRNSAAASSAASSTATPPAAPPTPACSATARCGSRRWSTSPSGSAPPPGHRPLRPHRRGPRTARCWPRPPTRPRTRATCWRRCRPSCSGASPSR